MIFVSRLGASALAPLLLGACTDAATDIANRCGKNNPPIDRANSPPGLVVRVAVEGGTDTFSAAGFCVRAERADGTTFEALTDSSGEATIPIDPAAGPWDVTAARYHFAAVSILGVEGPIAGKLFTEDPALSGDYWHLGAGAKPHVLSVALPKAVALFYPGPDLRNWNVFDNNVLLQGVSTTPISYMELFDMHANAPSFALTAFSSAGIFTMPPVARADHDISIIFDGTASPPPAAVATDVAIQMPWPVTAPELPWGSVLRPCGRGAQRCEGIGHSILTPLDSPSTTMPWHIDSFAPPMNPDVATATFDAMLGDGSRVSLEVATHSFGTTSTIVVPDWRSTKIEGASYPDPLASRPDDVHITTDADAYDGVAAFLKTVLPASGNDAPVIATVWRVFTYREASLAARPLPSLPAEMQMTDLVNGFTFFSNSRVWVLSGIDATHPPWSSASLDGVATVVASR